MIAGVGFSGKASHAPAVPRGDARTHAHLSAPFSLSETGIPSSDGGAINSAALPFLLMLSILTGCSGVPYTRGQKIAFGVYAAASVADVVTTRSMLQDGFCERNPFYGERPSDETLMAGNVITMAVLYGLGELWPQQREGIWWSAAAVRGSLAVHNERLKK